MRIPIAISSLPIAFSERTHAGVGQSVQNSGPWSPLPGLAVGFLPRVPAGKFDRGLQDRAQGLSPAKCNQQICLGFSGGPPGDRTRDTLIKSLAHTAAVRGFLSLFPSVSPVSRPFVAVHVRFSRLRLQDFARCVLVGHSTLAGLL